MKSIPTNTPTDLDLDSILNDFWKEFKNDNIFKAKVKIWHILIVNMLLDESFKKYYINFFNFWIDWKATFDKDLFLRFLWKVDLCLYQNSYSIRYDNISIEDFDIENIQTLIDYLKESIEDDIKHYFNQEDDDFHKNEENNDLINLFQQTLENFAKNEYSNLIQIIKLLEINQRVEKTINPWN